MSLQSSYLFSKSVSDAQRLRPLSPGARSNNVLYFVENALSAFSTKYNTFTPRLSHRLQRHQFPKSSRASRVLSLYAHRSSALHLACESIGKRAVNLLARFPADRVAVQEPYNIHAMHRRYRDRVLDV